LLILLLTVAMAEDPDAPLMVVTAERSDALVVDVPRALDIVTDDEVRQRQARSLPDALRESTGVLVQESNRGSGSPYLRGLVGPQNLVVVDGMPFTLSTWRTGPNQYLTLLDPTSAGRIEIIRGPSSVLYGTGAMGGVIQLVTHRPDPDGGSLEHESEMRASLASADLSVGASAEVSGTLGHAGLLAGGSFTSFQALRLGGDDVEPRSAYLQGFGRARAVWEPAPGHALTASWFGGTVRSANRLDGLGVGEIRIYDDTDHLAWANWKAVGFGPLVRADVRVGYHGFREQQDRTTCAVSGDRPTDLAACLALDPDQLTKQSLRVDTVDAFVGNVDAELAFLGGRVRVLAGADAQIEWIGSNRKDRDLEADTPFEIKDRGNFSDGSTYRTAGAFAHADLVPARLRSGHGELHVTGGARLAHFGASAPDVPLPDATGAAVPQDLRYAHTGVIGSAGLQWRNPGHWSVYTSFLQGYRAPNLEETTLVGPEEARFVVPNDDLGPERSDTVEGGIKLDHPHVGATAAGWATWIDGALEDAPTTRGGSATSADGLPYQERINVAGARYVGVEGDLVLRWRGVEASGQLAWTRGQVEDDAGHTLPARRVPPMVGRAGLGWRGGPGHAEIFALVSGAQPRLAPSDLDDLRICGAEPYVDATLGDRGLECPGSARWFTLNLRGSVAIRDGLVLDLSVLNLTDARYRTHGSGIDAPGLDVRFQLTVSL
jgi:hemoglobin/transferrin/lactoferrin receptor protein